MSELISRQDAINCCSCLHPEECWEEIRKLPSADTVATFRTGQTYGKSTSIRELVEVVRCKDCRYCEEQGGHANCDGYLYCTWHKTLVDEGRYCSWGERRTDD